MEFWCGQQARAPVLTGALSCRYFLLPAALMGVVLCFAWPWILPPLVFTRSNTHYAAIPAEANPVSYELPSGSKLELPIPKILHQTWKTETVPPEWVAAQKSCRCAHSLRAAPCSRP